MLPLPRAASFALGIALTACAPPHAPVPPAPAAPPASPPPAAPAAPAMRPEPKTVQSYVSVAAPRVVPAKLLASVRQHYGQY